MYSCAGTAQNQKTTQNSNLKSTEKVLTEIGDSIEDNDTLAQPEILPFELEKATSQKFSGGAPGSNTIYMYQIKLKKLTDKSLSFKALWTNPKGLSINFELKRKFQADDWANYKNNDELMLYAQKTQYGEAAQAAMKKYNKEINTGKKAPYIFKTEGLIEYELDGKTFYYEVENIEDLPSFSAP